MLGLENNSTSPTKRDKPQISEFLKGKRFAFYDGEYENLTEEDEDLLRLMAKHLDDKRKAEKGI